MDELSEVLAPCWKEEVETDYQKRRKKNCRSYAKTYENREHPSGNVAMLQKICQVLEVEEELVFDDYIAFMAGDYKRKLKEIREALGQTKAGMDKLLGQQKGVYGRWERGDVVIGRGSLEKVKRVVSDGDITRKEKLFI